MILVQAGNERLLLVHMRACRLQVRRRCCLKPGQLTVYTTQDNSVGGGNTVQEGNLLHSILLSTLQHKGGRSSCLRSHIRKANS